MVSDDLERVHAQINAYYSGKVDQFGPSPLGVDWTCVATQHMRFVQLLRVCDFGSDFSLNDLGCGYGALFGFCRERWPYRVIDYVGTDLSAAMVATATAKWADEPNARFCLGTTGHRQAHFAVASGLFNVCQLVERGTWENYVRVTLRELKQSSLKGFSANFLAPLPPSVRTVTQLYRTEPKPWIDFCQAELGCQVQLVDGYGMREFTLLATH